MELKNVRRGRIKEYAEKFKARVPTQGKRPWGVPCDVRVPLRHAERDQRRRRQDAGQERLHAGRPKAPTCRPPRRRSSMFLETKILYGPGKAANAGGVATSRPGDDQNGMRLSWTREEVDERLHDIMSRIHKHCVRVRRRVRPCRATTSSAPTSPASSRSPTRCSTRGSAEREVGPNGLIGESSSRMRRELEVVRTASSPRSGPFRTPSGSSPRSRGGRAGAGRHRREPQLGQPQVLQDPVVERALLSV